jgi:hypothetical protein
MYDIYIGSNIALTVDELKVAKRIADSVKEANWDADVTVRRHRCDIGVVYTA